MNEEEADEAARKLAASIEKAVGRVTYVYKLKSDDGTKKKEESSPSKDA